MPINFDPLNIFGRGQKVQGPAMTRGQRELQDFRNYKANQVKAQVNADAASGGKAMKAFQQGKKLSSVKDVAKQAGPLTQLTNSPLARFAGRGLSLLGSAYGGYELLRPGATTRERAIGGASIVAPLTPLAISGLEYVQDKLQSDRGRAFTQAMTAGYGNQALRHLMGNYQRVDGLTPDIKEVKPDIDKFKELLVKNAKVLPKAEPGEPGTPPQQITPPVISLREQLQQERETLGLTPMQQWAKANPELAMKVKEGQSGFNDIQAFFQSEDTGRTPQDMLAIMTDGKETLIGGEPEETPGGFRSERMAGDILADVDMSGSGIEDIPEPQVDPSTEAYLKNYYENKKYADKFDEATQQWIKVPYKRGF